MLFVTPTNINFEVRFEYRMDIIVDIKSIYGARWNPAGKCWCLPLEKKTALEKLGYKWGMAWKKKEAEIVLPELPHLRKSIPLKKDLFPYQQRGVAAGINWQRFINGDEPGLGKSFEAIATTIGNECKCTLVICPATLKLNWKHEFIDKAGINAIVLTPELKDKWQTYYTSGMSNVFICNFESLKTFFVSELKKTEKGHYSFKNVVFKDCIQVFDNIIIDEAHKLRNTKTLSFVLANGICFHKRFVQCLTGTPIVNTVKDLVALLMLTNRLSLFGGYKHFINNYNDADAGSLRELNRLLYNTCFFRRLKKDVLKDLPDKTYQVIQCDITTRNEYEAAMRDLSQYLRRWQLKELGEVVNSLYAETLVKIQVCRNIAARGKLEQAFEQIDEVIESGQKIVVFVHQKIIGESLLQRYPNAVTITGSDTQVARDRNVHAFQNNPATNIIIVSIKAGGVGITLTAAYTCLFIEWPWHAVDVDQCADRLHRIGQKNAVLAQFLLGKNTIDEMMYRVVESKRGVSNAVTGNDDNFKKEVLDLLADSLFKNQKVSV